MCHSGGLPAFAMLHTFLKTSGSGFSVLPCLSIMYFVENSSETARLLAKSRINNLKEYGVKDVFAASFTFEFHQIADGGKAAFAFGLKRSSSGLGSAGSGEVAFTYDKTKNCIALKVIF